MDSKDTRDKIVDWLNDMLDVDHDMICEAFTREIDIKPDSLFLMSPLSRDKKGIKVMTPLALLSGVLGKPIEPVFEDGIIQRFE